MNVEKLEVVESVRYLEMDVAATGTMEAEVSNRVGEGTKVIGALRNLWKERSLSKRAKTNKSEDMLYGYKAWALDENVHRGWIYLKLSV